MRYYFLMFIMVIGSVHGMEKPNSKTEETEKRLSALEKAAQELTDTMQLGAFETRLIENRLAEMEKLLDEIPHLIESGQVFRKFMGYRRGPWVPKDQEEAQIHLVPYFKSMKLMKEKGVDFVNTLIHRADSCPMKPLAFAALWGNTYALLVSLWLGASAYEKTSEGKLPLEMVLSNKVLGDENCRYHTPSITHLLASMAPDSRFKQTMVSVLLKYGLGFLPSKSSTHPSLLEYTEQWYKQLDQEHEFRTSQVRFLQQTPEKIGKYFCLPLELAQGVINYLPPKDKRLAGIISKEHIQLLVDHIGPMPAWAIPFIDHGIPVEQKQERGGCLLQ